MSPVNEEAPPPEPSITDRFVASSRGAMAAAGATDRMPFRVLVLFVVAIACMAVAPVPANMLGVAALVLLALDTSLHRR